MVRNKQVGEQMREHARGEILLAARYLFAHQGYFNTKISEIAGRAGMSQGNVYYYFSSKEEVLKAILSEGFSSLDAVLERAGVSPQKPIEKIEMLIDGFIDFGREQADFLAILLSLFGQGGISLMLELGFDTRQIGASYHRRLVAILEQARDSGLLPGQEIQLLPVFFFSFFNGLALTYAEDWRSIPRAEIRGAVFRLFSIQPG